MSNGFYELLGVPPEADLAAIRAAYQEQVAQTVRRLRAAEARQQDTATLEARRASLAEAMAVLGDGTRRRRYDRFRELAVSGFPADLDELWRVAGPSLVDPAAAAALEAVRTLTSLRVGDGVGLTEDGNVATPAAAGATVEVEVERTEPASETLPTKPVVPEAGAGRAAADRPAPDRSASPADVQRLLDLYGPTGQWLRAAREARKLDLDQLSANTKVARRFLEAMETENWGALPAATFVRGYLHLVVRSLELIPNAEEAEEAILSYMARFHRARG